MWYENLATYLGILVCLAHAGMFSGLNLAFFTVSRLQLEVESGKGNHAAMKVQALREDPNFLLATILWANVAMNVLLTLLSDSVMTGVGSFLFSTVAITLFGEISPQAYFSKHALKMTSACAPMIRFYQVALFFIAKPTALVLDKWLGKSGIRYIAESELKTLIQKYIEADEAEVDHVEGVGAINFLAIDDLPVTDEGEYIHPDSIIMLPMVKGKPVMPDIKPTADDPFLKQLHKSQCSWVILTDQMGDPVYVVDASACLRAAIFEPEKFNIYHFSHHPIVIFDDKTSLGDVIWRIKANETFDRLDASVLKHDVLLIWTENKRIITGTDIFGRLLKGIVPPVNKR